MNLKEKMDRFYLDTIINELRLANNSSFQNITYNSLLYMDIIAYKKECTVSYLAEALHVAKSAVTLKVKELEKLGLVFKEQSREDKRVHFLRVNQEVLDRYKEYDAVLYGALDEVEERYQPEQIQLLMDMFDIINQHFEHSNK